MSAFEVVAILLAGVAAGTINTIVGSGSLITFPTLLFFGYPPLVANMSNNVGLVPGGLSGVHGYRRELERFVFRSGNLMRPMFEAAKGNPRRVAYAEGEDERVLRAVQTVLDDGIAEPVLIGRRMVIEEKARAMGVTDIWRRDSTNLGPNRGAGYDLVFLDPPYGQRLGEAALASALAGGWLVPGALVVWEEDTAPLPPPGLTPIDQRRYGDTLVTLLRTGSEAGA